MFTSKSRSVQQSFSSISTRVKQRETSLKMITMTKALKLFVYKIDATSLATRVYNRPSSPNPGSLSLRYNPQHPCPALPYSRRLCRSAPRLFFPCFGRDPLVSRQCRHSMETTTVRSYLPVAKDPTPMSSGGVGDRVWFASLAPSSLLSSVPRRAVCERIYRDIVCSQIDSFRGL